MVTNKQAKRLRTINYVGWYGVLAILTAYALLSFKVIGPQNSVYQLLNLTGALGIITEAWSRKDMQPAALNSIWALVALIALIRLAVS